MQGHRIGLKSKHKGTIGGTYVSRVNERDPSYLTYLFHYASGILLGHTATFQQLANAMNAKAATEDVFPHMQLSRDKLKRWFKDMKGKELKKSTKPYLTEEQKAACVRYCNRIQALQREGRTITYLDEKWFYPHSRRKKHNYLPRQPFEDEGTDTLRVRKVVS